MNKHQNKKKSINKRKIDNDNEKKMLIKRQKNQNFDAALMQI